MKGATRAKVAFGVFPLNQRYTLPLAPAGPENSRVNAGAVLSTFSPLRFAQPLCSPWRACVFKFDPRHLPQTGEESPQRSLGQIEVLPEWKEKVQTRSLRTLQVPHCGMQSNVLFSQVGEDCFGQRLVEDQPFVAGGQNVRIGVGWALTCTAVVELGPATAFEDDLPKDLLLLETILPVEPGGIPPSSPGST